MGVPITTSGGRSRATGERYNVYFNFPGHANRREGISKVVMRRDNVGGLNLNNASNTQVFLAREVLRDPDFFGPVGSFPTRVYVTQTGRYRINYSVTVAAGSVSGGSAQVWISRNGGGGVMTGSMSSLYLGATTSAQTSCGASYVADLSSGDYLEIYATRVSALTGALNTVNAGSQLTIELVSFTEESTLGGRQVVSRPSLLEKATLTKGVSGYSGSTFVRVLKNGLSIMGSNDLYITSAQTFSEFSQSYFATPSFDVGDVVSLDVISEEAPYPRDLGVILRMAAVNG